MTVIGWTDHQVVVGGSCSITALLAGPAPITKAELRLNGKAYVTVVGSDLRQQLTFTWPVGPAGTYRVNVFAADGRGCSDTTGLARTVTVS